MKILVLGGCGIQGRTALHDLASDDGVTEIICADIQFDELSKITDFTNMEKITQVRVDAENRADLLTLYKQVDVVIDLLPKEFKTFVYEAALEARVNVVNTNYAYSPEALDKKAKEAGITIMPECGLDPGIDLVIYGDAKQRFDSLSSSGDCSPGHEGDPAAVGGTICAAEKRHLCGIGNRCHGIDPGGVGYRGQDSRRAHGLFIGRNSLLFDFIPLDPLVQLPGAENGSLNGC